LLAARGDNSRNKQKQTRLARRQKMSMEPE